MSSLATVIYDEYCLNGELRGPCFCGCADMWTLMRSFVTLLAPVYRPFCLHGFLFVLLLLTLLIWPMAPVHVDGSDPVALLWLVYQV